MTLFVVHSVDTEGPLHEPLDATFDRIKAIHGVELEATAQNLRKLQDGALDLGDREVEAAISRTLHPRNLRYLDSWERLDEMLDELDGEDVRLRLPDHASGPWRVNWHCMTHHGFDASKNPRRRDLGMHAIFDHYQKRYGESRWSDSIHWHFHPTPRSRQANHSATAYFTSSAVFEIISRRVLERLWFPCVNRPGFHAERPDSHWFLEQWMPFDLAHNNTDDEIDETDLSHGRFGDWRRAPKDWVIYHPHHDDYQKPGDCRRAIGRCLYLGGRFNRVNQNEVDKAFLRARKEPTVMSFTNHDYRVLTPDVIEMQDMLAAASKKFSDVEWFYSDAAEAMRGALGMNDAPHARFDLALTADKGAMHLLEVRLDRPSFGPQPWLCYALKDGTVWHDNLDWGCDPNQWHFCFDEQTAPLEQVSRIGLAVNTPNGRTTVTTLDPHSGKRQDKFHN